MMRGIAPRSEFESAVRAGPVYRLFGRISLGDPADMPALDTALHGDGVPYHIRDAKHDLAPADWAL